MAKFKEKCLSYRSKHVVRFAYPTQARPMVDLCLIELNEMSPLARQKAGASGDLKCYKVHPEVGNKYRLIPASSP